MAILLTMYNQLYRPPMPHLITDSDLFYQYYVDKLVFSILHKMYLNRDFTDLKKRKRICTENVKICKLKYNMLLNKRYSGEVSDGACS